MAVSELTIGFTGSRLGATSAQFKSLRKLVRDLAPKCGRHGDCIGADVAFHGICLLFRIPVIIHPPLSEALRAHCTGAHLILEPKPYLERNHAIVSFSACLIACPSTEMEQQRSGTWATVRYARRLRRPIYTVLPSGHVREEAAGTK